MNHKRNRNCNTTRSNVRTRARRDAPIRTPARAAARRARSNHSISVESENSFDVHCAAPSSARGFAGKSCEEISILRRYVDSRTPGFFTSPDIDDTRILTWICRMIWSRVLRYILLTDSDAWRHMSYDCCGDGRTVGDSFDAGLRNALRFVHEHLDNLFVDSRPCSWMLLPVITVISLLLARWFIHRRNATTSWCRKLLDHRGRPEILSSDDDVYHMTYVEKREKKLPASC